MEKSYQKKKMIVAVGKNADDFISEMRRKGIPFLQMKYVSVQSRRRKEWDSAAFAERVEAIMSPDFPGEKAYVVITGIRSIDGFHDFIAQLNSWYSYQTVVLTLSKIQMDETLLFLEEFLYGRNFQNKGVIIYRDLEQDSKIA